MTKSTLNFMTKENTSTTPLDISQPLRRRDGGEFEIWKKEGDKIFGRIKSNYPVDYGIWYGAEWSSTGRRMTSAQQDTDLLAAPRRIKGWVNIYKSTGFPQYNCGTVFDDKKYCEPSSQRIACIYIDVEEGEGINI